MNLIFLRVDASLSSAKGVTQEAVAVPLIEHYGGAEGTRTPDLLLAKEALSQLSYSPTLKNIIIGKVLICNLA